MAETEDKQPMTELGGKKQLLEHKDTVPMSEEQTPSVSPKIGLAFSGGGIRSAAFCSGVLRRMLQKSVPVDYLSCVSGGGYTGTSYLDWKFRNEQRDDPAWHKEYFAHMRSRAGLLCNWQKPLVGILDTLVLLALMLLVTIVIPFIIWLSCAIPVAYAVDYIFGNMLRAKPLVYQENYQQENRNSCNNMAGALGDTLMLVTHISVKDNRITLFAITISLFIILYIIGMYTTKRKGYLLLLSGMFGLIFAMTFLPWFIRYFFYYTPPFVQAWVIIISVFVWYFFPVLRTRASMVMIIYLYAYVVFWRIYKKTIWGLEYSERLFAIMLLISGLVLWLTPILGMIQQRAVFDYNRWRLQRAFYHPSGLGLCGCRGIISVDICLDIFDWIYTCFDREHKFQTTDKPLTMEDLTDVSPQYISNIVVNEWSLQNEEPSYHLLTISPNEIERIHHNAEKREFNNKLNPKDIKLSEAMATSAAAVARHMGAYDNQSEGYKDIQTILGLGMGASMPSNMSKLKRESFLMRELPILIVIIRALPLVVLPAIWFFYEDRKWLFVAVFTHFLFLILLSFVAVLGTGQENPNFQEKIVRWFLVHITFVRFIREMMRIVNVGPMPPAILRLSDGGHFENLALLPLLKKRLKKIVVVNGGHTEDDDKYASDIIYALQLAREMLHCSFIGYNGRDVIADVREKFSMKRPGEQPRMYKFKVEYYHKESKFVEGTKVGEGEILLLAPRHPDKGVKTTTRMTWSEVGQDLEAGLWGTGPELDAEEVDRLTWCCCECCHGSKLRGISEAILDIFPQHNTANQFFTPSMFSAYHREGYRACVEGGAAEFLGGDGPITTEPTVAVNITKI